MREWQRVILIFTLCLGLTLGAWSTIGGTGPSPINKKLIGKSGIHQGTKTQVFFDDFDGTDLSSDWVIVTGGGTYSVSGGYLRIYQSPVRLMINTRIDYAVSAPCKITTRVRASGQGMRSPNIVKLHRFGTDGNDEVTKAWFIGPTANTARMRNVNNGAGASTDSGNIYLEDITEWHTYSLEWRADSTSFYQDDILKRTLTSYIPDEPLVPAFWSAHDSITTLYLEIDWVRLETLSGNPGMPFGLDPVLILAILAVVIAAVVAIVVTVVVITRKRSGETPIVKISRPSLACKACGSVTSEGDTFCLRCGAKLEN